MQACIPCACASLHCVPARGESNFKVKGMFGRQSCHAFPCRLEPGACEHRRAWPLFAWSATTP